jgi:hypothetical protein
MDPDGQPGVLTMPAEDADEEREPEIDEEAKGFIFKTGLFFKVDPSKLPDLHVDPQTHIAQGSFCVVNGLAGDDDQIVNFRETKLTIKYDLKADILLEFTTAALEPKYKEKSLMMKADVDRCDYNREPITQGEVVCMLVCPHNYLGWRTARVLNAQAIGNDNGDGPLGTQLITNGQGRPASTQVKVHPLPRFPPPKPSKRMLQEEEDADDEDRGFYNPCVKVHFVLDADFFGLKRKDGPGPFPVTQVTGQAVFIPYHPPKKGADAEGETRHLLGTIRKLQEEEEEMADFAMEVELVPADDSGSFFVKVVNAGFMAGLAGTALFL